jgi:glycine betaine transporter
MGKKENYRPYEPFVFWISASITIAFVAWSILLPERMNTVTNAVF